MKPTRHLIEHTSLHTFPPLLDDWVESRPDAWDYDAILREYEVSVEWRRAGGYWWFSWKHGCIHIGQTTEIIARKAAALFVSLWLRNVSASFCDKLMDGFICYLERQEQLGLIPRTDGCQRCGGKRFYKFIPAFDSIILDMCLDCGQVQGKWPLEFEGKT
jgi:hypothetical protein